MDELAVARELHDPVVAALAVSVQDVDLAAGCDHNLRWPVEAVELVAPHPRDAERHEDLTLRAELEDLLPFPCIRSRLRASPRRAVGDPDVAFVIDEEAVGPCKNSASEVRHDVSIEIELEDGIQLRIDATVGAAAVQHPHVPSVGVREHARDGSPGPSTAELSPVGNRQVFPGSLGGGVGGHKGHNAQGSSRNQRHHGS